MKGRAASGRIAALLCVLGLIAAACAGDGARPNPSPEPPTPNPSATPQPTGQPTPPPSPTSPPTTSDQPPDRDLIDLARRFRGLPPDLPDTARQKPFSYRVGDREEITVLELEGPSTRTLTVTVRAVTENAYFLVEDGTAVDPSTLERITSDFETLVYPRVTTAFGREWSPGVDADPRISMIHADLGLGGYFSSSDEFPRQVVPRSNEREAVYLDASALASPGAAYNALLAHELQHLIHWPADSGEESWVDEGLSQVAAELVGGGTGVARTFLTLPDTQLNAWPDGGGVNYGTSQLFFRYLLDRFGGRQNAAALLAHTADGIAGVDAYLQPFDTSFLDVFADWLVANYLDAAEGPYAHEGADLKIAAAPAIDDAREGSDTVHQFAADYLAFAPPADGATFTFDGSDEVGVGIEPFDGAFWWSNQGDSIDSRLTREFDLTGLTSASLRFRASYDIEFGWDYAYVAASTDGGRTWQALAGRHTTDFNPVDSAYGPGYTGRSDGWLEEEIDLTPFAGGRLILRFEYVTDDSVHGRGFAVDDIEIPELRFADDAGTVGGWLAEGFRRIEEPLRQLFLLQIIEQGDGDTVRRLELAEGNRLELTLDRPATIVISAVTESTTELASYDWSLSP